MRRAGMRGALLLAMVTVLVPAVMAQEPRRSSTTAPSAKNPTFPEKEKVTTRDEATPGKPSASPPVIAVKDGRLTLKVENLPLEWVLEEISRKARIAIVRAPDLGSDRITRTLQDVPVDEALRQILVEHDSFLFFGVEKKGPAALRVVWVYPRGRGRGMAPISPEAWASTQELIKEAKTAADPTTRAQAVEALVERKRDQASDVVRDALQDPADDVRARALYGALNVGAVVPADSLARLALTDPSSDVRFLALEGLRFDPSSPHLRPVVEQALNDPHPLVRKKAEEILEMLDPVQRPALRIPQQPVRGRR